MASETVWPLPAWGKHFKLLYAEPRPYWCQYLPSKWLVIQQLSETETVSVRERNLSTLLLNHVSELEVLLNRSIYHRNSLSVTLTTTTEIFNAYGCTNFFSHLILSEALYSTLVLPYHSWPFFLLVLLLDMKLRFFFLFKRVMPSEIILTSEIEAWHATHTLSKAIHPLQLKMDRLWKVIKFLWRNEL